MSSNPWTNQTGRNSSNSSRNGPPPPGSSSRNHRSAVPPQMPPTYPGIYGAHPPPPMGVPIYGGPAPPAMRPPFNYPMHNTYMYPPSAPLPAVPNVTPPAPSTSRPKPQVNQLDDMEMEIEEADIISAPIVTNNSKLPPQPNNTNNNFSSREQEKSRNNATDSHESKGRISEKDELKKERNKYYIENKRKEAAKKDWFLAKIKYQNTLPDLPLYPKFVTYPFDSERFISCKETSLEKNFKFDLKPETNLGFDIDLIDSSKYTQDPKKDKDKRESFLNEKDLTLLQEPVKSNEAKTPTSVPWLKKTEFISIAVTQNSTPKENSRSFGVQNQEKLKLSAISVEKQVEEIEKTFEKAKDIPRHPKNPNLKPVEILPIFPDFELWPNTYVQCSFDTNPALEIAQDSHLIKPETRVTQIEQSIFKPMVNPHDPADTFLALCVPTEETITKRQFDEEIGEEYGYDCVREYRSEKSEQDSNRNYFFILREELGVFYNECKLKLAMQLRPKRHKSDDYIRPSGLIVERREMNIGEKQIQDDRINDLLDEV